MYVHMYECVCTCMSVCVCRYACTHHMGMCVHISLDPMHKNQGIVCVCVCLCVYMFVCGSGGGGYGCVVAHW